ncbi:MAG TPA: hypothetical protein VME70_04035 [Mycobacteriales bacterium]|nr:hypothetical protein [Mycobacteriales bacterium]
MVNITTIETKVVDETCALYAPQLSGRSLLGNLPHVARPDARVEDDPHHDCGRRGCDTRANEKAANERVTSDSGRCSHRKERRP